MTPVQATVRILLGALYRNLRGQTARPFTVDEQWRGERMTLVVGSHLVPTGEDLFTGFARFRREWTPVETNAARMLKS